MNLHRAWRFELDPNNKTRTLLSKHAGVARFVWNWSLARRIEQFKTQEGKNKFTNYVKESKKLNALKKTDFPWIYEVSKCAPLQALRNLDKAFTNFWKHRKDGAGFPKFKRKGISKDSFYLTESIHVNERHIILPRLGLVRIKNKSSKIEGRILSATISRVADRWFVSISTIQTVSDPVPVQGSVVGIDLGLTHFATLSDGTKIESPKFLKKSLDRLKKAQQIHARKKKGSNNRRKSALKIAKIHAHIANCRKDFLHKITTKLAKTKSVIVIENLQVSNMMKNHCLARSISDAGWGEFARQLSYKTGWYGSKLVIADRWFPSSKLCSDCGHKLDKLPLSIREWVCPMCGYTHDRDENAAKNLEKYPEFLGNLGSFDDPKKACGDSSDAELRKLGSVGHGSTKQEVTISTQC